MNKIGIIIGKYINNIVLNDLEYALDENGDIIHFDNIEEAKQFLRNAGINDEDELDNCFQYKYHTYCLNCDKEYILNPYELFIDELGVGYYCNECDSSFDV